MGLKKAETFAKINVHYQENQQLGTMTGFLPGTCVWQYQKEKTALSLP